MKRQTARDLIKHEFFNEDLSKNLKGDKRHSDHAAVPELLANFKNEIKDFSTNKIHRKTKHSIVDRINELDLNKENAESPIKNEIFDVIRAPYNHFLKKNVNIQILECEHKEKVEKQKDLINLLASNDGGGAFFSVSMTVYSQHSIGPQIHEIFLKENKILPTNLEEEDEDNDSLEKTFLNNEILDQKYKIQNENSMNTIGNLLNEKNNISLMEVNKLENLDKLSTLDFRKEEIQKLEQFFK